MRDSLRSRLTLSYILISLVCILTISILTNVFLEKQFREYTIRNQERKNEEIADLIGKQYGNNGVWNYTAIENMGVNVIEQGMIIRVIDNYGRVVWDAAVHNNGLCKQMLDNMVNKMSRHYNNWDGKYRVKEYSIYHNKNKIGNVVVGYYGPFYYNDNDFAFIHALNKFLIGTGVFSLFFALILGGFMAKWLSNPIDVAHELRTPLATIQSYIEAMIDGIWKPDRERLMSCHEEIMRITRLVGRREDMVKISVKDTGIGISPEDLPFVFERFYRADKSRNKLTGGSGIGLTIAKTIVDLHKGRITVQNNFDKGTEFIVLLPKASSNK
ncbi:sensor histidine kinase [Clostridium kluyveri]|uniref:histidine kinase n=2 Tax=Clostridium kluyveri TaxID=1534 RepID=A5N717_CLOK5|nr:ATP-binding protein [Clostridium kluyveri]EDK33098.1 Two component sensor kinase [Clostridium kluyveri DSM 555]BAH06011.1 hypothetical protein CKR_0960 [Clostridium kluyveri NBRC 12016]